MKKFKAVFAVVMIVVLTFMFAACSNGGASSDGSGSSKADTASSDNSDSKSNSKGSDDLLPEFDKSGTIKETHMTDVFDVSITATELTYTNSTVELSLKLENKSNAKREVCAGTAGYGCNSVNGYMIHDGYLNCDLDPGASAEEKISFSYGELNVHGINKIADIGIGFDISDENFKSEKSDMVFVKTQNADSYNYNEDTYLKTMKGNSLQNAYGLTVNALSESSNYSEGNVSILSQTIVTNKDGKSSLMVEFENKSDQALYINLSNLKLNGTSVNDSFVGSDLIWSSKKSVISISLKYYLDANDSLNANNIKSAAFTVKAANLDNTPVTQGSTVTLDF